MQNPTSHALGTAPSPRLVDAVKRIAPIPSSQHFDELKGQDSPWHSFFEQLGQTDLDELDRRTQTLARQVRDNGITYNVYANQGNPQRPWSLDLFPLLLTPESWQHIETGVKQRASLLEHVMADVYGPQQLIREAMIPPAPVSYTHLTLPTICSV